MGPEDLQLLLVQKPDDKLDLLIYDPMPGGSGLLEQMLSRWKELITTARELAAVLVPEQHGAEVDFVAQGWKAFSTEGEQQELLDALKE